MKRQNDRKNRRKNRPTRNIGTRSVVKSSTCKRESRSGSSSSNAPPEPPKHLRQNVLTQQRETQHQPRMQSSRGATTRQPTTHQPPSKGRSSQYRQENTSAQTASTPDAEHQSAGVLRMHTPGIDTWLYISGFANDITAAILKEYISEKLHRSNIECHLLLRKGIDPRSQRSLSFKARIPSSCAYIAMHHSFWPDGISVRHFVPEKDF